ncbi:hypothetical protein QJS66_22055 [Kocuria rhizophila]|nr:hypothetical protein QJS66_22055 [Kocuria rhizophila]
MAWARQDAPSSVRISELLATKGLDRVPAAEAGPGDVAVDRGHDHRRYSTDLENPSRCPPSPWTIPRSP